MILGQTTRGGTPVALAADTAHLLTVTTTRELRASKLAVLADGGGATQGTQLIRSVVYDGNGALVAAGTPVAVLWGDPARWVDLPGLDGVTLPPGGLRVGVLGGPVGGAVRIFVDATPAGRRQITGPFDAPPGTLPTGTTPTGKPSLFLDAFAPWTAPRVDDVTLAALLPWEAGQRALRTGPTAVTVRGRAGWHDTAVDPETGAFAVVRRGGPFEKLLGERLLLQPRRRSLRSTVVVAHEVQEWPDDILDEDVSLTRRAWLELGNWGVESLPVTARVLS